MQRNTNTFSDTTSNRSSNVPSVVTYSQSSSQHLAVKPKTFKSSSVTTGMCICMCRAIYHIIYDVGLAVSEQENITSKVSSIVIQNGHL